MTRAKSNLYFLLLMILPALIQSACSVDAPESTSIPLPQETPIDATAEPDPTMATGGVGAELEATAISEGGPPLTAQPSEMIAVIRSSDFAGIDQTFTFDASQSQSGELPIVDYMWDMGDGTTLSGIVIKHAYDQPGFYKVTLTISSEGNRTATTHKEIEVTELLQEVVPTTESEFTLSGTSWEMNNAVRGTTITLAFGEKSLSGSSGCNNYSAAYSTTPIEDTSHSISISSISSTNQSCTLEVMGQEQGYLESLAAAARYTIDGDMLTLETGRGVLTFSRAPQ